MGVVNYGKQPKKPLSEKQVQADLLGHMQYLLRTSEATISFIHIYSYMDKHLDWEDMTREQQLNVTMDKDAEEALEKAVENDEYIKSSFPHERLKIKCGYTKVTGSATEAIYDWKSRHTAKALYHKRGIVDEDSFELICWKGVRYVTNTRFNNSFATFYTKHMIGCCGVRRHLHYIDNTIPNVCPCCNEPDKTTSHILLCKDEDRTNLFKKSVQGLMAWMVKEGTSPQITEMVGDYLRARNDKTMAVIYTGPKTNDR